MRQSARFIAFLLAPLLAACGGSSRGPAGSSGAWSGLPELISAAQHEGRMTTAGYASDPDISGDGAFIAYVDYSGNAVPDDTNEASDILLYDVSSGSAMHISLGHGGEPADDMSVEPALDQDGSHCAFSSLASNLVPGDSNDESDIFLRDVVAGTTRRISVDSDGNQAVGGGSTNPRLSADGSIVVFASRAHNLVDNDTNLVSDVFVHDCNTGVTERVSVNSAKQQATGGSSFNPDISADGRYVVFESHASNLVDNDTNNRSDVFLHDRLHGTTTRVSTDSFHVQGNDISLGGRISADGAFVVFSSFATNLLGAGGDTNGEKDIFVHEVGTGETTRVSVSTAGVPGTGRSDAPSIDATGRFISFVSHAPMLVDNDTNDGPDVFLHDRARGETTRISTRSDGSEAESGGASLAVLSDDGTQCVFVQVGPSFAPDGIVPVDEHNVFHKDLGSGALTPVSVSVSRAGSDGNSGRGEEAVGISPNGRWIAFASNASNLVPGDTNNLPDIFRRDTSTGATERVLAHPLTDGRGDMEFISISNDGRFICFLAGSEAFGPPGMDLNDRGDIFVYDVVQQVIELVSVHTDGTQHDSRVYAPRMSADGRFVVFEGSSRLLVDGKSHRNREVFLRDRQAGTTERVVFDKDGLPTHEECTNPDVSDDGRYVIFESWASNLVDDDLNGTGDVFIRDMQGGVRRVSVDAANQEGTGYSWFPSLSGDGRFAAFNSTTTDLVANDTNGVADVFRKDLQTGEVIRITVGNGGEEITTATIGGPAVISRDGNSVLFSARDPVLVSTPLPPSNNHMLYIRNIQEGTTRLVGLHPDGEAPEGASRHRAWALSADGDVLVYGYSTLGVHDVYRMKAASGLR